MTQRAFWLEPVSCHVLCTSQIHSRKPVVQKSDSILSPLAAARLLRELVGGSFKGLSEPKCVWPIVPLTSGLTLISGGNRCVGSWGQTKLICGVTTHICCGMRHWMLARKFPFKLSNCNTSSFFLLLSISNSNSSSLPLCGTGKTSLKSPVHFAVRQNQVRPFRPIL